MTPEQFSKAAAVFEEARHRSEPDRAAYLRDACGADARIRVEVESLLAHHDDDSAALSDASGRDVLQSGAALLLRETTGGSSFPRVEHFTILRQIGAGGMAVVFEAVQDNPRRTVALKMIRPEASSAQLLKRFDREVNVLGGLQHAGIAQIHEAGTIEGPMGPQPFFAMEYVDGQPLTRFAQERSLTPRERLEVFLGVCDAVSFAHDRHVIHRDLKPANILVDGAGRTKVLDFGVARVIDPDLRHSTLQTEVGQLVGTIPYMSPEQVRGDHGAVDARADIYALGVVLFELLSGRQPYELAGRSIPDAVRVIENAEPSRLGSLNRLYRGDIETIVAKALEKDPQRRYPSVADLAADIRRYLADEPIVARPASTFYQMRKFARRNRALVAGVAGVFLALVAGIIGTGMGLVRARRAERIATVRLEEAERQTRIAEAVNDFLNDDLFSLADPENSANRALTLREALDKAAERVEGRFEQEPLVEAAIRVTLGRTYRNLAAYELADAQLTHAAALRESSLGPGHNETLKALNHLAILRDLCGRYDQAEQLYRRILDARLRTLGPDHRDTLATMNNLRLMLRDRGRDAESEPILTDTFERRSRLLPPDDADRLVSTNNLASLYWDRREYERALPLYESTLEARRRTLGADHPQTLNSMDNLSTCLMFLNRHEEAEALTTDLLARSERVLGPEHPKTTTALNNLAAMYFRQGQFDRAEPVLARVVEVLRRAQPEGHWTLGSCLSNYGVCLRSLERYEEAEQRFLEAHRILAAALGPSHDRTTTVVKHLITL